MKKPLLTTIGIAGACAACCAVPLLVPIISGLSVAGLFGLDWDLLTTNRAYLAAVAGIAAGLAVALGLWLAKRRRAAQACGTSPVPTEGGSSLQSQSSCGCSGNAQASTEVR